MNAVGAEATFKVGTVFRHGVWLEPGATITLSDATRPRAICRVTAIRHGKVYYGFGADSRKSRYSQSPEKLLAAGAVISLAVPRLRPRARPRRPDR